MAGRGEIKSQLDDESSSIASFEDVGCASQDGTNDNNNEQPPVSTFRDLVIRSSSNNKYNNHNSNNKNDKHKKKETSALVVKTSKYFDKDGLQQQQQQQSPPDVLYVVQYRNHYGKLINTKTSDKPIEIGSNSNTADEDADDIKNKRPVIEIITRVKATRRSSRRCRYRTGPPRGGADNVSDDDDDDAISVYSATSATSSSAESELDCIDHDDDDEDTINSHQRTDMIVSSRFLKNALAAVVGYYPGIDFGADRLIIPAPYQALVHHRESLNAYKLAQPAAHSKAYRETTNAHIDVLLGFLDKTYSDKILAEERLHRNDPPAATFEWYWLALKPGEVIYAKKDRQWTPFVISACPTIMSSSNKISSLVVQCWYLKYNAGKIQRRMKSFSIRTFAGEQAIHSLNIVPARFFRGELPGCDPDADPAALKARQVELGRLYWELVKKPAYKDYDGALVDKQDGCVSGNFTGRVIVDAEGFEQHRAPLDHMPHRMRYPPRPPYGGHRMLNPNPERDQLPQFSPRCGCKICSSQAREETGPLANFEDLDPTNITADPPRNELYYWVLSKSVPAFLLSERRWGHVSVAKLRDVKPDREAFKYLVLDDEIKLTVKALIGKFASADGVVSPWPRDLVKNKGEGRIFLLHGSPGVGKTCTAECVAELTHRPLLSLTSGDISTDMSAASVERNLSHFLTLGERYGALVLLDEADVYLEERRTKDLHRNGLVSIFLRALEYYRGVLFLTTNRVEAFDSAFTSRIHVALHYRKLSDDDRLRIWQNNFERLERDSGGKVYVSLSTRDFVYESDEVRELRWNGREIRNALQTAVALAETEAVDDGSDKVNVTDQHLRSVVRMSRGFKDFLKRRGCDADDSDCDSEESDDLSGQYED